MRRIVSFNFITLDGYFAGPNGDISWHSHSAQENEPHAYAVEMLKVGATLLFGRVTYQMMASYWPTPQAIESDPIVAEGMNKADKIVFSSTLKQAAWSHTTIVPSNLEEEIKRLKQLPGKDMTVLGSGSILTQLAQAGLVDEYQFMVDPIALGDGASVFKGIKQRLQLELTATRTFKGGNVLLCYRPGSSH